MAAIAIVGPDGAGKTSITRRIVQSPCYAFKYIYMGINIEACNYVLPTTRWAAMIKRWIIREQDEPSSANRGQGVRSKRGGLHKGKLWAAARLLNNFADEWYRQLVSWYYQWRGFIVIYDRHFVFDFWDDVSFAERPSFSRIHVWSLRHLYPRPSLVIFLDAPPEVLYARKPEWPIEYLERKRQTLLELGKQSSNFCRIDATQPLEAVYEQVLRTIGDFCGMDLGNNQPIPVFYEPTSSNNRTA